MSLISQVLQEIDDEDKRAGESQCFIGHEFRHRDLRVKLERALERLGLQAYFADKEVTCYSILTKICKKILVTRASIVDLSQANPNVYFELGIVVGLNKPVLVVLKHGTFVPPLLENFVKLRFTNYTKLEEELVAQVPGWLEHSIEYHILYNTHCHLANVLCPERQRIAPQRRYLVIDEIEGADESRQAILTHDADLRAELPGALDRFHFTPVFLEELPLDNSCRLCDYCRALRRSDFTLCHITRRTSPNVYFLLGLATGLDIPSLRMVHKEYDKEGKLLIEVPTILRGLDGFFYEHSVDIGERLCDEVEGFLNRQKSKPIIGRTLAFPDLTRRLTSEISIEGERPSLLISSSLQLDELLTRVLEAALDAVRRGPDVFGSILLYDAEGQYLEWRAAYGYPEIHLHTRIEMRSGNRLGWASRAALELRSRRIDDVYITPDYIQVRSDIRSELAVPMAYDGQLIGVINLESPRVAYFTEEDMRLIELLASQAAIAIHEMAEQHGRLATARETLSRVQAITDPSQQTSALIALLDELTQIRDMEGIRCVVEIALTIEEPGTQTKVLKAASGAYEALGDLGKAGKVASLIPVSPQSLQDIEVILTELKKRSRAGAMCDDLFACLDMGQQWKQMIRCCKLRLQEFKGSYDLYAQGAMHMQLGMLYLIEEQPDQALRYCQEAVQIFKICDGRSAGVAMMALGKVYESLAELENALQAYQQSAEILSGLGDPLADEVISSWSNLRLEPRNTKRFKHDTSRR